MRREGRQHGWVFTVDPNLFDAESKQGRSRGRVLVEGAAVANGGFVRVPRKPTNHSKPSVGRARKSLISKGEAGSGRDRHKFKHDDAKMMYYLYLDGADDACADAMLEFDSQSY